jgi:cysteine desulfurase
MYLDSFAAARSLDPEARRHMQTLLQGGLGNPSSAHKEGRLARKVLREARAEVAAALGADPDEVVFTSGVTESLALACHGLLQPHRPTLVACSVYEHAALREALVATGLELHTFAYDSEGRPQGALPAVAMVGAAVVNHEVGLLARMPAVCDAAAGAPVIVDAAQGTLYAKQTWADPRVSAMALSSHKIGGPTGAGALLVRKGHPFVSWIKGGPQEHELRAGTEAVIAAAGYSRALTSHLGKPRPLAHLTQCFEHGLKQIRGVKIVAEDRARAPGVTAAYALGVAARALAEDLDARGVYISAGAACAARSNEPSSVLTGLGLSRERALEVFRVSFFGDETDAQVTDAVRIVKEVIDKRRGEVANAGP